MSYELFLPTILPSGAINPVLYTVICGVFQVEVDDLLGIGDDQQEQQQQQQYPAQPVQAQGDSYDYSGAIVPTGGRQTPIFFCFFVSTQTRRLSGYALV